MSLNETVIHKIEIKGVKPSPILFRPRLLSSIAVIVDFVDVKFGVTIPYWRQFSLDVMYKAARLYLGNESLQDSLGLTSISKR